MNPSFCPNCGAQVKSGAKFCPSCGNPLPSSMATQEKPTLSKGQSKSLKGSMPASHKTKIREKIEEQVKQQFQSKVEQASSSVQEAISTKPHSNETLRLDRLGIWGFLIINFLLIALGNQSNTVLGILFFSFLIGVLLLIRRKKPKPVNWAIKIILVLQVIGLSALILDTISYIGVISLLMILLLIIDLRLIFKGNQAT